MINHSLYNKRYRVWYRHKHALWWIDEQNIIVVLIISGRQKSYYTFNMFKDADTRCLLLTGRKAISC